MSTPRPCGRTSRFIADTLPGTFVEVLSRRRPRATITRAQKFYLFDIGIPRHLAGCRIKHLGEPEFGCALEHFVLMELLAYRPHRKREFQFRFWRAKSGQECDFVLGRDGTLAIGVNGSSKLRPSGLQVASCVWRRPSPASRARRLQRARRLALARADKDSSAGAFLERLWSDAIIE